MTNDQEIQLDILSLGIFKQMLKLKDKINKVPGIGKKYQELLEKLGIFTVSNLLFYFPVRYDDFSSIVPITSLQVNNERQTIQGKILSISNKRTKRGFLITSAIISDDSGSIQAIWFNQPFLTNTLQRGNVFIFSGKVKYAFSQVSLQNPDFEQVRKNRSSCIMPVYSVTEGISSKWLRAKIKYIIKAQVYDQIKESLPPEVIEKYRLLPRNKALKFIHFPESNGKLEKARFRLGFEELFEIQLRNLKLKKDWEGKKTCVIKFNQELAKDFVKSLPFSLTSDQKIAAWEILRDLGKEHPANRLLEGDTGSGKTVVSVMAILQAVKQGYQTVLMVPTEILARQHFKEIAKLTSDFKVQVGLLTGVDSKVMKLKPQLLKNKEDDNLKRKEFLKLLAQGKIDLIIGTHALIQDEVKFKDVGLVVIDEQHRFGVEQRKRLFEKVSGSGKIPHLVTMTATPIPRSLALALYSNLDLSVIKEMPRERKRIDTFVVPPKKRDKAYKFIEEELRKGHQTFVICPVISESKLSVKSVEEEFKNLSTNIFPSFKVSFLHGRLKAEEKEKIMRDFLDNKAHVLVSTSVVEVGVNIPNATVMLIEGAERFGLAQLHQFRGRVGRSELKSHCFLFTDSWSENVKKRLYYMQKCYSGFELARHDLELRGPGEMYGIRQSGIPDLKMASLSDARLIKLTREAAETCLKD